MRTIDANALAKQFQEDIPYGCGKVGIKYVDDLIKNFPTVIDERITKALGIAWQYGQN